MSDPSAEGSDGADLERRAVAAYLAGNDDDSAVAWEAAQRWRASG